MAETGQLIHILFCKVQFPGKQVQLKIIKKHIVNNPNVLKISKNYAQ
jgi:hypothetical protein